MMAFMRSEKWSNVFDLNITWCLRGILVMAQIVYGIKFVKMIFRLILANALVSMRVNEHVSVRPQWQHNGKYPKPYHK